MCVKFRLAITSYNRAIKIYNIEILIQTNLKRQIKFRQLTPSLHNIPHNKINKIFLFLIMRLTVLMYYRPH